MAPWQRYTIGTGAMLAWLVLLGVSLTANYKFGHSLGSTPLEQEIIGFASVASDIFKSCAIVILLWLLSRKSYAAASAIVVLGGVAMIYSLVAATGFMAGERYHRYHELTDKREATKQKRELIERMQNNRDWLPTHKPLAVLEAERAGLVGQNVYRASNYCTATRTPDQEKFCRTLRELDVAIAAAKEATKQDQVIAVEREHLQKEGRSYGDAQVEFWASRLGLPEATVLWSLVALSVLLIELGSMLGFTVAMGLLAPERMAPVIGVVVPSMRPQAPPKVVPKPEDVAVLRTPRRAASFSEPAADKPEVGGLRSKIRPVASSDEAPARVA